ncbi:MAG: beta-ketoacyl-[acyl-carrier-protein] synthase family protein [Planctomycetota bacterium]|nr:MAG: beta-ketoacyl-[acyl-carrier-protein] synthase family protein [Planctomycetota bacterium]REJ90539.1 MAG: beta-ketoacyl-[acyl-carrier-protein] synthase family protein [Planctomycetota bacterium]REK24529.1 MAG: beta-ketoacyl-[acyl-carrier-protein] synthase family protein [Planctomycetota bacterium]REK38404.1 MAG: beta-ketoacyl-[acyl-carrier-protein] synthase family protein [Planctomycetota bacterium]
MAGSGNPRVVITGVGVISPIGTGTAPFWSSLIAGRSGIDYLKSLPADDLPCKLAAEVKDFDPLQHLYHRKFLKVMSRDIQLGVCAASMAMADSGLVPGSVEPDRMGVEFGTGHICFTPEELGEAAVELTKATSPTAWSDDGIGKIAPLWLLDQLPNMPACHVAIEHNARGPNNTITSADASAILALQEALRVIQRGHADVMIVGATSSNIHPVDIARRMLIEEISQRDDDPTRACRPFDRDRDGTIVGEGSAVFVVERYGHALRRGADIYCEVLGVGAGCDGRKEREGPGGAGLVRAMQAAVGHANIRPDEIGHINAHGKSTRQDDWLEARCYHRALGSAADRIPVVALKSYVGNFEAGSGAVELAGSVLSLRNGELPISLNYEHPDPLCRLNVVHGQPLRLRNRAAMSVNRTAIGQSAAAILRAV